MNKHQNHHATHHRQDRPAPRVYGCTVSDTRTAATDKSGSVMRELLLEAGFLSTGYEIIPDEPGRVREVALAAVSNPDVDAVVFTGGTGVGPRDVTAKSLAGLEDFVTMPGFGELFRMLSYEEIGTRAMLSNALAGHLGTTFLVALPGSSAAVRLGISRLVVPQLPHIVGLLQA